ncbi:ATP-dependent helicase Lhr and Lhr-like helicase [Deinococcus reticulitermitis]|uniref:ATP-dependent helicase Lhr and Lhr-like helicase n=1 Tax=Deinococcus reticulitermitis TaxID=856736 RepID=A0A1H6WKM3_9DEIO|nr:DEAD/DEAH box helicase [Deinococcus reticulitermitis]SEJ17561.1 ATP-dependent helicase Lhr and Lhr-like helicase [Deinococcus reticulitermitis]
MSALTLLTPQLRHGITDVLRWSGLRPVQEASIPPVLAGVNVVILAPTAGGKTEAAFLPALDVVLREGLPGVSVLYVSPLVALLNNQEARAETLAGLVGMSAFKWHGGVNQSARRNFLDDPAQVLLTTPESLEAMLIGRSVPVADLFVNLRFVIIDEVHAFASSDRGAHLIAVMERLAALSQHDVQRIGLSATVLNPAEIGRWMKGRSARRGRVVRPDVLGRDRQARITAFTEAELAAGAAYSRLQAQVTTGKSLIFTESRVDAEKIASTLHRAGHLDFVGTYHSAISLEARGQAEDAMNGSEFRTVCLACTSAMELGIDIGDLDRVVQWSPPGSVSSLLQRWGRTGRREGRPQSTTIYAHNPWEMLTALAEVSLAQEGWAEPVHPRTRAYHILFQQILNRVMQSGGMGAEKIWTELNGISAFRDITSAEYSEIIAHLTKTEILTAVSGVLVLGDQAEKRLGAKRFQALITSFDTPDVYTVRDVKNHYEVGQLESWFVDELRQSLDEDEHPVILLTGRPWQVMRIHDVTATIDVQADQSGQPPKWQAGTPRLMEERLAWRHRELLVSNEVPDWLNAAAQAQLTALRGQHQMLNGKLIPWQRVGRKLILHTYAGTRINKTLELVLKAVLGKASSDNFTVTAELSERQDVNAAFAALRGAADGVPSEQQHELTRMLKPMRLSKYQAFLPDAFGQTIVADHLLDFEGLQAYLSARKQELELAPEGRQA